MSERGSFMTEFMYCLDCRKKMRAALNVESPKKYLAGYELYDGKIIAGKIGGLYRGEEIDSMQFDVFNEENAPCHPVRVAILTDSGRSGVFVVKPNGVVETVIETVVERESGE